MSINFDEMFGTTPLSEKAADARVRGFQVGAAAVHEIYDKLRVEYADEGREFQEGILEGLRELL